MNMRFVCFILLTFIFGFKSVSSHCLCPQPWRHYNKHCYIHIRSLLTFQEAESWCNNLPNGVGGGHLVSILSKEELDFLRDTFQPVQEVVTWIGLTDLEEENVFVWTDGSHVNYTKFEKSQPDNNKGQEHCIHMKANGKWNDYPCFGTAFFICKSEHWNWHSCGRPDI